MEGGAVDVVVAFAGLNFDERVAENHDIGARSRRGEQALASSSWVFKLVLDECQSVRLLSEPPVLTAARATTAGGERSAKNLP